MAAHPSLRTVYATEVIRCPLRGISGHLAMREPCPLYPQKRTFGPSSVWQLLDLISAGEQRGRHSEADRFRGLEIDNKLEFGRRLHRQVAGKADIHVQPAT